MAGRRPEPPKKPSFIGGAPCLDFLNTVSWRGTWRERDDLPSYIALVSWCRKAGLLGASEARALAEAARRSPASANQALTRVLKTRDSLHALFMAVRSRRGASPRQLAWLNRALATAPRRSIAKSGGGLRWERPKGLDGVIAPVLWSAADVLAEAKAARVRLCAGPECGWLFLDHTGRRRWCDMADCGNRAKARRHYRKVRKKAA